MPTPGMMPTLMDFITFPELFLSIGGVVAVFVAISGLMLILATELTEQVSLFWIGIGIPVLLLILAFFMRTHGMWLLIAAAIVLVIAPIVLAVRRPTDCGRPIATGLTMLIVGGVGVGLTISAHYTHFAR